VCPYNQAAPSSPDGAWQPRAGLDLPRLVDVWRRSDRELRKLVKGGPMTRAKVTGLRRNLAVAIGNSGDREAVAALEERSAERPSADAAMVQEHIRWAAQTRYHSFMPGSAPLLRPCRRWRIKFAQTVILLCDYTDKGAFGLVVNRQMAEPAHTMVGRIRPFMSIESSAVAWGP
jgi:hypothetical protein